MITTAHMIAGMIGHTCCFPEIVDTCVGIDGTCEMLFSSRALQHSLPLSRWALKVKHTTAFWISYSYIGDVKITFYEANQLMVTKICPPPSQRMTWYCSASQLVWSIPLLRALKLSFLLFWGLIKTQSNSAATNITSLHCSALHHLVLASSLLA